jgi:NAD(P)-dependent dehydrogenase (short-subunit alcohol dehydrogenase family)
MDGMSRVMANELGRHGIRVNCINPIVTMTEQAARAWSDPVKSDPVLSRIPISRFAETADVANMIAFRPSVAQRRLPTIRCSVGSARYPVDLAQTVTIVYGAGNLPEPLSLVPSVHRSGR